MTTSSLYCSLSTLPTTKVSPSNPEPMASSWDLNIHLPRWEHHPLGRSGREAGALGQEWIRIHLP